MNHFDFWTAVAHEAPKNIPGIWDEDTSGDVFDIMSMEEPFAKEFDIYKDWTPEIVEAFLDRYADACMMLECECE